MICHWDEVPESVVDTPVLRGRRRRLADAAGAPRLGLSRYVMGPGERVMPVHAHGDEEEIFVVLDGSGLSLEGEAAHPIAAGDAIRYPAGGPPHTTIAGEEGLDLLAFSSGSMTHLTWLPRPNAFWAGPRWIPADGPNPFKAEVACGPLEPPAPSTERPPTIVRIADVEAQEHRCGDVGQRTRKVGDALGAGLAGLRELQVDPGRLSNPPHCHSAEDELFVVTSGDGALELLHADGAVESLPVHAGHVVSLPAGSGTAHAFGGGDSGLTLLAYGHRDPSDVCFYPRSGKLSIRGVNAIFRVQRVDYWDGER